MSSLYDILAKIEDIAVGGARVPLTGKALINDNDLIHYVNQLRHDLPKSIGRADKIIEGRDQLLEDAEKEAAEIRQQADDYVKKITSQEEVVKQAQAEAKLIIEEAHQQAAELMATTKKNVDAYTNQVFDQLIAHVSGTSQGVQQALLGIQQIDGGLKQALQIVQQQALTGVQQVDGGLQQALQVLQQAKSYMIQQQQQQQQPPQQSQPQAPQQLAATENKQLES